MAEMANTPGWISFFQSVGETKHLMFHPSCAKIQSRLKKAVNVYSRALYFLQREQVVG